MLHLRGKGHKPPTVSRGLFPPRSLTAIIQPQNWKNKSKVPPRSVTVLYPYFSEKDQQKRSYSNDTFTKNNANQKTLSLLFSLIGAGAAYLLTTTQVLAESQDQNIQQAIPVLTKYIADQPVDEEELTLWYDLLLPETPLFLLGIIASLISSFASVYLPRLVGKLLDQVRSGLLIPKFSLDFFQTPFGNTVLFGVGIVLAQSVLQLLFSSVLSLAVERITTKLKLKLFGSLIRKDIALFDQGISGEIMATINNEAQEVRSALKHSVTVGVRSISQIVGGFLSLFLISKRLSALMIVLIPSIILIGSSYVKVLQRLSKRSNGAASKASAIAQESLVNVRTIRAFGNEDLEERRYGESLNQHQELSVKMGVGVGLLQALQTLATYGSMMFVLMYGGTLVSKGEMSAGDLTSFMMYSAGLQSSMSMLSILQSEALKGTAAANKILKLVAARPSIPVRGGFILPPSAVQGHVEFKNVSFRYPSRPTVPVLEHVNLNLEPGKKYALVGPSGSGKTTISSLVERFYDPVEGQIFLDGIDIKSLDPTNLRQNFAIVQQEPTLFATSIEENIRFAKPTASRDEIYEAAKIAHAHDFIVQFPEQYSTIVGERGVQLSGGQKQRIAIARAVLKDAKVVILDEATSALDVTSERTVQNALNQLMQGRTVLIIAHRLSTVQNCDKIFVVKNGKIVEEGTHQELISKNGTYSDLVSKQQLYKL